MADCFEHGNNAAGSIKFVNFLTSCGSFRFSKTSFCGVKVIYDECDEESNVLGFVAVLFFFI